ncbi:MAG: hypothetical protein WB902_03810, partial [Acetobacteraceae bacterium]
MDGSAVTTVCSAGRAVPGRPLKIPGLLHDVGDVGIGPIDRGAQGVQRIDRAGARHVRRDLQCGAVDLLAQRTIAPARAGLGDDREALLRTVCARRIGQVRELVGGEAGAARDAAAVQQQLTAAVAQRHPVSGDRLARRCARLEQSTEPQYVAGGGGEVAIGQHGGSRRSRETAEYPSLLHDADNIGVLARRRGAQGGHRVDRATAAGGRGDLHRRAVNLLAQRAVGASRAGLGDDHQALLRAIGTHRVGQVCEFVGREAGPVGNIAAVQRQFAIAIAQGDLVSGDRLSCRRARLEKVA